MRRRLLVSDSKQSQPSPYSCGKYVGRSAVPAGFATSKTVHATPLESVNVRITLLHSAPTLALRIECALAGASKSKHDRCQPRRADTTNLANTPGVLARSTSQEADERLQINVSARHHANHFAVAGPARQRGRNRRSARAFRNDSSPRSQQSYGFPHLTE